MSKPKTVPKKWTAEEVTLIGELIASSPTHRAAFQEAANRLGRNYHTVEQKWYALQRAARKNAKANRRVAAKKAVSDTMSAMSGGARSMTVDHIRSASSTELATIAQVVKAEVERRRAALDRAAQMFAQ